MACLNRGRLSICGTSDEGEGFSNFLHAGVMDLFWNNPFIQTKVNAVPPDCKAINCLTMVLCALSKHFGICMNVAFVFYYFSILP